MSKTDKTKPLKFRMQEAGFTWRDTTNLENLVGVGRGGIKFLKRLAHKRNRKRLVPHASMRGHGRGEENYKYAYRD